jgi:hypothetical protein
MLSLLRLFAETSTERPVNHVLERHPKFPRTPLQEAGQVIVYGQGCTHGYNIRTVALDVKTSIYIGVFAGVCVVHPSFAISRRMNF